MTASDRDQTLYLVDVSSFIFRAFYAIRILNSPKGEPTNATYGVATMLKRLLEEANPKFLSIIYDSKEPSFRKKVFQEYKANRSAPPDDLIPQFGQVEKLIQKMGISSFRQSGIEADDLIATMTRQWLKQDSKNRVIIVTGDKDLMQLVEPRVRVWDTMKEKIYEESDVQEKFGIPPTLIRDYLALVGDSSDNIPGVKSIGPKSAVDLLQKYQGLESVLKAAIAGEIPGKKGEVLRDLQKDARLSYELVTLKEDLSLDWEEKDLLYHFAMNAELSEWMFELGFKTLVDRWGGAPAKAPQATDAQFVTLHTAVEVDQLIEKILKAGRFCFDLETTSLNPRAAEIVGIALAYESSTGYYLPVGHREGAQLDRATTLRSLQQLWDNPKIAKVGQNLKYDLSVLRCKGIEVAGVLDDTMVAAYVLNPTGRHNFDTLCQAYLSYQPMSFEEVCGKGKNQITFDYVSIEQATRYSAEDAVYTWRLWEHFEAELKKVHFWDYYCTVERPLVPVLMRMELEGVRIDSNYLHALSEEFQKQLEAIEKQVQAYADEPVNLQSPKQLAVLLFEKLKLTPQGKTKTGYSTDFSVLEALVSEHEVPGLILTHREIAKLKGTYVDPLPLLVDPKTGKIHGSFHQTVTATGRLSSSDPNLQNIPIRTERGQRIRKAFIPSEGNVLLSADYSQIELRILAHLSGDDSLVDAFQKDEDVHRRTARDIFDVSIDAVTEDQRSVAKAINFGLMYGKTPFGLAQELHISRGDAKDFIDRYFQRYHKVKSYLDHLIQIAHEAGYAQTMMGRRRPLPDLASKNPAIRQNAERMAMNTPIQGTAAELMKLAMIRLDLESRALRWGSKPIIQVHDELVLDCPREEVAKVAKHVRKVMESAMQFAVPLRVNLSSGKSWLEMDTDH